MSNDSSSRIVAALREWIATAPPGAKLPSTRSLVSLHGASPVTVQKALRTLVSQGGVVEARPGVGTFVRAARVVRPNDYGWQTAALGSPNYRLQLPMALQSTSNDVIALHSGYPARELLPEGLVRAAFTRATRTDAVFNRPLAAGLPELQSWFASELGSATPAGITPPGAERRGCTSGQSGWACDVLSRVGGGRDVRCSWNRRPTGGAILAAAQAGVTVIPISSGANGPDPEELSRAFEQTGARAFYAQPSFASPTGALWSPSLADKVLDTVRRHGAFLIEDSSALDFGITADPSPIAARDDSGHVVYLRALTKSVSPSVRVAGLIARGGPAYERILADTQQIRCMSAGCCKR